MHYSYFTEAYSDGADIISTIPATRCSRYPYYYIGLSMSNRTRNSLTPAIVIEIGTQI